MAVRVNLHREEGTMSNIELFDQLESAVNELREKMKAYVKIERISGSYFGVNKMQRGIAADQVISITKAIKALKGC